MEVRARGLDSIGVGGMTNDAGVVVLVLVSNCGREGGEREELFKGDEGSTVGEFVEGAKVGCPALLWTSSWPIGGVEKSKAGSS